jgi:uncharacterized protein (TIGR03083 family)
MTRIALAAALGLITGIVWGLGGHLPPSTFFASLGWALLLGVPVLAAIAASVALERDLRGAALQHARPAITAEALAIAALLLLMAIFVTLLPDTFTLGVPVLFSLALGLGTGFALGGMRLWGMSGDARWLFVALGVASLFGVTLTFLAPAALAPQANGQLGFIGCLTYILGLPGAALGSIAGGALRMRAELEAYGYRSDESTSHLDGAAEGGGVDDTGEAEPPKAEPPKEQPMTADQLIATLTAQRQGLLDVLAGLTDEQLDRTGVAGDWSIKNTLGHLAAWEETLVRITPDRLRTGAYPEELRELNADEDASNARIVNERTQLTPADQLAELDRARAALVAMIRDLGDDALARERPWPEWEPPLADYFLEIVGEHEREHGSAIRAGVAALRTP